MSKLATITPDVMAMLAVPFKHEIATFKDVGIMTAFDNSMSKDFKEGDVLFIDTETNQVHFDGVYAFNFMGYSYVARLQLQPGCIVVLCSGEHLEPWDISNDDYSKLEIVGRVIGSMNLNKY